MPDERPALRRASKGSIGPGGHGGASDLIMRRIAEKGPIPFAEFMEMALYAPGEGYYSSGRKTWGPEGDYITSIDVSPAFARALARQILEFWELLGSPSSFELIEAGAGRGWLTFGILDHIRGASPAMHKALHASLVEQGGAHGDVRDNVTWHSSIDEIRPVEAGCIISNELIDAFPVHRVEFSGGVLHELYVDCVDSGFFESAGPLSDDALGEYFQRAGVEPFEGMKTEVNLEAARWVKKAASILGRGFVLTIDYGVPARELYSPERKGGSLHCHFRHTLNDNPFVNVGEQDITAHVDFTTLALSGRATGLELTGFTTQKNFLLGLGILEELKEPASLGTEGMEEVNFNRAIGALISPGGMGDTFKVMVQHKGVAKPSVRGFSFKDMTRSLCLP